MGLYCSCTLTAHFTSTIFSICSSLHTALRQIGLYNCYKDSMLLICLSSATQRMVWWKCDRWMCDHVPGHCCGGTSLRWACMWWSTTTWRHQMKGASGSTQRLCPSSKPPALIKSSESISSSGEHLPSRFQGDAFRCEGISASFIFFIRISVWQILCFFSLSFFFFPFHVTCSPFRGPGDVIGDCKIHFLDEIYQVEKPGARALSAADGQFKRMNELNPEHWK